MRVFVSYSRHEITFADSLARDLEKRGHEVWIDYKDLVPGRKWDVQIAAALEKTQVALVVVSRESVASEQVEKEWRLALERGKRVILLIFEAQPLPEDLAGLEWVDFRKTFKRAVDELEQMLQHAPANPTQPAPQSGRRLPPLPRLFFILSIVVAIASVLFMLPTLILPWYFVRLPRQIRRREYRAGTLVSVLAVSLPLHIISWIVLPVYNLLSNKPGLIAVISGSIILIVTLLLMTGLLWFANGMYRWAAPGGVALRHRPRTANRPVSFVPVTVALDYANQDGYVVVELANQLRKAGHTIVLEPKDADLTLVLLSRYKQTTQLNIETTPLLPVLLQTTDVDPALSVLQWIDLRRGTGPFAQASLLLGHPAQFVEELGILPVRDLTDARPPNVGRLANYFLIVLIIKALAALVSLVGNVFGSSTPGSANLSALSYPPVVIVAYFALSAFGIAVAIAARRSLFNRGGIFRSAMGLTLALGLVAYAAFPGFYYLSILTKDSIAQIRAAASPATIALVTSIIMCGGPLWAAGPGIKLLKSKDVVLWMARQDDPIRIIHGKMVAQ